MLEHRDGKARALNHCRSECVRQADAPRSTDQPCFSDVEILLHRDGPRFKGAMACAGGALTEGWSFNVTFKTLEVEDRDIEEGSNEDR